MSSALAVISRLITSSAQASAAAAMCLALITAAALIALLGDADQARAVARVALDGVEEAEAAEAPAHAGLHEEVPAATTAEPIELAADQAPPASLPRAPVAGVFQPGPYGVLPAVGAHGETALHAYARPAAPAAGRPTIAVVVGGLGRSRAVTQAAIEQLPPDVTLAFSAYAPGLQTWINAARAAGHEVALELPMEPFDYPANDPGPHTLLADASPEENARRIDWLMARGTGYFAVINRLGARFTTDAAASEAALARIGARGVGVLYDGAAPRPHLPETASRSGASFAAADRMIDTRLEADALDEQLLYLEALAIQNGDALGLGQAYPLTVEMVGAWADALQRRGFALAPASAVLNARAARERARLEAAAREASAPRPAPPGFSAVEASFGRRDGAEAEAAESSGGH